jgi:hypothetical protein
VGVAQYDQMEFTVGTFGINFRWSESLNQRMDSAERGRRT